MRSMWDEIHPGRLESRKFTAQSGYKQQFAAPGYATNIVKMRAVRLGCPVEER
jgi:hypothetical protein